MVADQVRSSRHTRAQEDYLKALYHLEGDRRPVPTSELAQRLRISAASVSEMVTRLSERGLVSHDRYRGQQLTAEGRVLALELVRHHRLLEMFLVRVLGYGLDEVHEEAERLEHVICSSRSRYTRPWRTTKRESAPVARSGSSRRRSPCRATLNEFSPERGRWRGQSRRAACWAVAC